MANIQVSHSSSANNARSESCVAADPFNPNKLVGASKKFSDPHAYQFTVAAYFSNTAGNAWTESAPLVLLPGWAGITDPAITWDDQGNCFLVTVAFRDPLIFLGIAIYKSDSGGATWSDPVFIDSGNDWDKPWAIGDPGSGTVYVTWDDGLTLRFARTTDHGTTWTGIMGRPAGTALAADGFASEMAVDSNGHLYIFWSVRGEGIIKFLKTENGGDSFWAPQVAVSGMTDLQTVLPMTNAWPHLPGGRFRVLTFVTCCVGYRDQIMVAWADGRETDAAGAPVSRIYYRRATDGGLRWEGSETGSPLLVNNASLLPTMHHFHPQIINRPNSNQIACSFYEYGPKAGGRMLVDTIIAYSSDDGASFGTGGIVTDTPWDPLVDAPWSDGDPQVDFIGDYFGLDASNVGFYPFWTDTRTGIQEIFTAIVSPVEKSSIKDFKDVKDHLKEYTENWQKVITKDHIPDKPNIKDKDDKEIYEGLGQKLQSDYIHPLQQDIDRRLRTLESKIQDLDRRTRKGEPFISPRQRPDVAGKVVKQSNRRTRAKKKKK